MAVLVGFARCVCAVRGGGGLAALAEVGVRVRHVCIGRRGSGGFEGGGGNSFERVGVEREGADGGGGSHHRIGVALGFVDLPGLEHRAEVGEAVGYG